MSIKIQQLLNNLTSNPKLVFLIDGLGACLSAFVLGVIMTKFNDRLGMPINVLHCLAAIAGVFAIYSISCHFLLVKNWRPYLRIIMIANLIYCCLTLGMVIYFLPKLTTLSLIYFVLELLVIIGLVCIEKITKDKIKKAD